MESPVRVSVEGASSDSRDVAIFGVVSLVVSAYSSRFAAVGLRPDRAEIMWTDDREGELNLTFKDAAGLPTRFVNFIVFERGRLLMNVEELESELARWIEEVVLDQDDSQ